MKDLVLKWFANNSTLSMDELMVNYDINYLEQGVIDSFGFLSLISFCEDELGIILSDDDFSKQEIFTISGIVKILENNK